VIPAASQSPKIERRQRRDRAVEDEGENVSVATVAFGKTCLKMIALLESPSARAALTYSKFLARRHSARTTCTSLTQENSKRMPSSTKKLGTMIEAMMIKR